MFIKKNMHPFEPCSKMHTAFNKHAEMQYWFMSIFPEKLHVTLHIVHVFNFSVTRDKHWIATLTFPKNQIHGFDHARSPLLWRNKTV